MKIQVLYDNDSLPGFKSGWGFSCYLPELKLLFDTGWDPRRLLHNMNKFEISTTDIEKVFLSHSHWDHTGGLPAILEPHMEVIVPASFSEHMKEEIKKAASLLEINQKQQIEPGIHTSGELGRKVKEQALAVETEKGLLVITGCAHPGVGKILKTFEPAGKIGALVGGLHGFNNYPLLKNMQLIAATHCTKHKDEIAQKYPDKFKSCRAGDQIFF
ncbi:MAG: MBL fold metallo-hydrolase [bacterium]